MTKIKKGRYDTLVVVKKVSTFSSVISSFHYKSIGKIKIFHPCLIDVKII